MCRAIGGVPDCRRCPWDRTKGSNEGHRGSTHHFTQILIHVVPHCEIPSHPAPPNLFLFFTPSSNSQLPSITTTLPSFVNLPILVPPYPPLPVGQIPAPSTNPEVRSRDPSHLKPLAGFDLRQRVTATPPHNSRDNTHPTIHPPKHQQATRCQSGSREGATRPHRSRERAIRASSGVISPTGS